MLEVRYGLYLIFCYKSYLIAKFLPVSIIMLHVVLSCIPTYLSCMLTYWLKKSITFAHKAEAMTKSSSFNFYKYYNYIIFKVFRIKIQLIVWIETVALNQSCTSSDQCAGSPYASCFGGKCTCIEGYTSENTAKCFQSMPLYFCVYNIILIWT